MGLNVRDAFMNLEWEDVVSNFLSWVGDRAGPFRIEVRAWWSGSGRFGIGRAIMKLSNRVLARVLLEQRWAPLSSRGAIASDCSPYPASLLDLGSSFGIESSSRWLPAASLSSGESSSRSMLATWGAALMAGVVAMEFGRSDGVACSEGAERAVSSPMGKTPESKLAQPTFYLSG